MKTSKIVIKMQQRMSTLSWVERGRPRQFIPKATKPRVENHNSPHEQDRRKRQIAAGQLREANGLVR